MFKLEVSCCLIQTFGLMLVFCIKTTLPLVCVLREVDLKERPAMSYFHELMDSAKENITFNCGGVERKYSPIWRKIDARWTP